VGAYRNVRKRKAAMTDLLRIRIFDLVYENGPLSPQYLAAELEVHRSMITRAIRHPWFYVQNYHVHIAIQQPQHPMVK
jgi:hypothetical protein